MEEKWFRQIYMRDGATYLMLSSLVWRSRYDCRVPAQTKNVLLGLGYVKLT